MKKNKGFSLVEVIACFMMCGVVLLAAASIYKGVEKQERASHEADFKRKDSELVMEYYRILADLKDAEMEKRLDVAEKKLPAIRTSGIEAEDAVRAILGEARGEGGNDLNKKYACLYAHACALRNRGTLTGVAGYVADMETIPVELLGLAERAWYTSAYGPDRVHGATHWLSDYDLTYTSSWKKWIGGYKWVARVGHTNFYKAKTS